jgi:uncharacterized SAM-binding protein YcdF (DUF218 family)
LIYDFFVSFIQIPGLFISILFIFIIISLFRTKKVSIPLFLITVLLYIFSCGWFARLFVSPLENNYLPPSSPSSTFQVDDNAVIVILGGGIIPNTPKNFKGELSDSAFKRVIEGYLIHKRTQLPIIVTGGKLQGTQTPEAEVMKEELQKLGVCNEDIYVEPYAKNTKQNAQYVKEIVENEGFKTIILVTSAVHMTRSLNYFNKYLNDKKICPIPTGYLISLDKIKMYDFLPQIEFLKANASALHEYLGIIKMRIFENSP